MRSGRTANPTTLAVPRPDAAELLRAWGEVFEKSEEDKDGRLQLLNVLGDGGAEIDAESGGHGGKGCSETVRVFLMFTQTRAPPLRAAPPMSNGPRPQ